MLTRRHFLVHSAMAAAAGRVAMASMVPAKTDTVVEVSHGKLRGEATAECSIFRGVPFARPPVGALRFRAPQPVDAWSGVRDATAFAAASVQPNESTVEQSEDCLYLNVWAPRQAGPHPVFVWIHGGGFTGGCSFDPLSDGARFARNGIVCITVAYRLGVLGFMDVAPLLDPSYAGSANNALRDLIAALGWVQTNVAAFGGDPKRVTIGGESAGAKLTDMLMGIPSASGLFHQMISESGGAERIAAKPRAEEVALGFGKLWTERTELQPSQLLEAPARQIVDVQQQFTRDWPMHFPLRAEVEGSLMPQAPILSIRAGSTRGKRLLLGTNRDESASFIGTHPDKVGAGDLGNLTVEAFQAIAQRYQNIYPAMTEEQRRIRSVTAEEYWVPSMRVAEAHVTGGGEAFVYRLDFPGRAKFAGLSVHAYDLRFVWEDFGKDVPSPAARKLAAQMHAAWTAFIHGKAPAATGLPEWSAYSTGQRPTMILDETSHMVTSPNADELALWDGLLMS